MKKVLRKKVSKRALARHNCHSGLDPESYKRWTLTSNVGKILNLSWICSTLAEFRLRSYAPVRSICSLSGFHPLSANNSLDCLPRQSANPQVQDDSKRNNPITNLTSYRLNVLATCAGAGQGAPLIGLRTCGHAAFTMADRLSRLHNGFVDSRLAFTMAEILLSLTIIGVVAAITLPSLTGNINERTWNTQRKALYARFSQALALMPNLNGYGKYSGTNTDGVVTTTEDTAAETFVTEGLSKVLKINNICDNTHLQDCGIVTSYTNLVGSIKTWPTKLSELNSMFTGAYTESNGSGGTITYTNPQKNIDTKAAAFETQNGESIAIYYNPNCVADMGETSWYYSQPKMCANFIYDLNGNKGPNTVGKDIGFITALYPSDPIIVAPVPLTQNVSGTKKQTEAGKACTDMDSESKLPNRDELAAMFYNRNLIGIADGGFWSSSVISSGESGTAWVQTFDRAAAFPRTRSLGRYVRCVKR